MTIAIPFYRGQEYLRRAIQSVFQQTSPEWRLIICDDAGPESGTAQVVAKFADPRVAYLRNDRNSGMAANWNRCLEAAETDLVNLLHNDDELLPEYVETMLSAAVAHPGASGLFCQAKVIDANGHDSFSLVDYVKRFLLPHRGQAFILAGRSGVTSLMYGDFIICPTMCYRKSCLPAERFRTKWKQVLDLDFFIRILLEGGTLVGLPNMAYAYRRHDENATAVQTNSLVRFEEESAIHDEVAEICRQRCWRHAESVARRKRVIQAHLLFRLIKSLFALNLTQTGEFWRFFYQLVVQERRHYLRSNPPKA